MGFESSHEATVKVQIKSPTHDTKVDNMFLVHNLLTHDNMASQGKYKVLQRPVNLYEHYPVSLSQR